MRFAFAAVVLAGVLSTASALSLQARQATFPSCSDACVTDPPNTFGCDISDNQCLCENTQYVAATTQCIEQACDAADAASAEALSRTLCAKVGVTLTSTPAAPTSSGSSSSASGASPAPSPSPSAGSSNSISSSGSSSSNAAGPSNTPNAASSNGANVLVGAAALLLAAVNL